MIIQNELQSGLNKQSMVIYIFTIEQYVLPPILCFSNDVNFESLYGICLLGFYP